MTKEVKLNPATEEMSGKILEAITVGVQGNAGTVANTDSVYESLLPSDPLPATWKEAATRLNTHNELFIAAAYDAVGDASRAAAGANAELRTVDATFGMLGRNKLDVTWQHSVERNAGIAKAGEVAAKKIVHGAMSGKLTVAGTDTGSGELGKVTTRQKNAAYELFGAKETA